MLMGRASTYQRAHSVLPGTAHLRTGLLQLGALLPGKDPSGRLPPSEGQNVWTSRMVSLQTGISCRFGLALGKNSRPFNTKQFLHIVPSFSANTNQQWQVNGDASISWAGGNKSVDNTNGNLTSGNQGESPRRFPSF